MERPGCYGYAGKMLRVDLTTASVGTDTLEEATLRKYLGGTSLGVRFLYDEVAPDTEWSAPANRLFIGSGPLGGTRVGGSGCVSVVTVGALTNGGACTQANGFFGAYLRSCGFDAAMVQGAAPHWVYLHVHDGTAELRNAAHLTGKDVYETEAAILKGLGRKATETSILSIGPAGENLVRFACICVDSGHIAAHNGVGAVMGSKKLKAIAVDRGKYAVPLKDGEALGHLSREIREATLNLKTSNLISRGGTLVLTAQMHETGSLPVRNYTTGVWDVSEDELRTYSSESIRARFRARNKPCWACQFHHCSWLEITEGKYAGTRMEEPEYEGIAAWGPQVGIKDVTTTLALSHAVDRLGMDTNEAGWVIGWVIECSEKGILGRKDTDGLEMTWGNGEAIMALLHRIARREGFGNVLAEGVMRAAARVGGEAVNMAVGTRKGNSPRGHDHRTRWLEMFDTCVSNTGTLESQFNAPFDQLGLPAVYDGFDPLVVSAVEAKIKGAMMFEDCLVTCRFNTTSNLRLLCRAVNAATGWALDINEAMAVGRRGVNLLRVFNLRRGIGAQLDAPSPRYGSTPVDGVAAGRGVMPHLEKMLRNYYALMGWDEKGIPRPETLRELGLEELIRDLPE